jgi:hypothetical protein
VDLLGKFAAEAAKSGKSQMNRVREIEKQENYGKRSSSCSNVRKTTAEKRKMIEKSIKKKTEKKHHKIVTRHDNVVLDVPIERFICATVFNSLQSA